MTEKAPKGARAASTSGAPQSAKTRRVKTRSPTARSAARLAAVQALYQMDMTAIDLTQVIDEFEAHRLFPGAR